MIRFLAVLTGAVTVTGVVVNAVVGDAGGYLWWVWVVPFPACLLLSILSLRFPGPLDPSPARRVADALGFGAAMVLGATAVLVPAWPEVDVAVSGLLAGVDRNDMTAGDRQTEAVAALAELAGNRFRELHFYDDGRVIGDAPISDSEVQSYQWSYGDAEAHHTPIPLAEAESDLFDVREIDFGLIPRLRAEALTATGITEPGSVHVAFRRSFGVDEAEGQRALEFSVSINVDHRVEFDQYGQRWPPCPEEYGPRLRCRN